MQSNNSEETLLQYLIGHCRDHNGEQCWRGKIFFVLEDEMTEIAMENGPMDP
jgi:hypothetical protein